MSYRQIEDALVLWRGTGFIANYPCPACQRVLGNPDRIFCDRECEAVWAAVMKERSNSRCNRPGRHDGHAWERPGEGRGSRYCRG